MNHIFDLPLVVFLVTISAQYLAACAGDFLRTRFKRPVDVARFSTTLPASLTLLGLIIGFSFSLAVSRYDQRKNYEEDEANAIGTEYVLVDFLPAADAARTRELLVSYTAERIRFYEERNQREMQQIAVRREDLQNSLWKAVEVPASAQRDAVSALVVKGMNDVLNSQGYTQSSWWNRIPVGAWILIELVAFACNMLIGYSEKQKGRLNYLVLPAILAISLFMLSDLDSPRGGIIHVMPLNLIAVYQSMGGH